MNVVETGRGNSAGGRVGQSGHDSASPGMLPLPGMSPAVLPTGKGLVEGYRKDILSGFEKKKPRYNPLNENRPHSSALVDLKDPIQVHLLTETALSDSKAFEILSPEEVDDLKKQIHSLSMRVEQARANLVIQSKYHDAAVSMARLYSPAKAEGKRRSLLGNRMSDSAKEAEMEKLASERRCEEIAAELFSLEKRLMEPQRRLLEHTAGILQMTHRASAKNSGQIPVGFTMNGIPGSPESLYTYTHTRNSMDISSEELEFDRSLYLPLDQPGGPAARPRKNTIEIPMKSPIREQNAQLRELREEVEKVKEENERILEENIQLKAAERQLQDELARLTASEEWLREEVSQLQSREQQLMDEHARAVEEHARIKGETSRMLDETSRFKDADARLRAIEEQMTSETEALRIQSAGHLKAIAETEARLEGLNRKLRDLIVAFSPEKNGEFDRPGAAAGSGETLESQLAYMESGLSAALEELESSSAGASAIASSLSQAEASLDQASARIQALASQVHAVLEQTDSSLPPPPGDELDEQLDYMEGAFEAVVSELSGALQASSSASATKQNIDQVDAVLMGLWDIIQTGEAEIEQKRAERRQNRSMGQGGDDDDDLSSNELESYINEPYSLPAFSAKVQWLYAQATSLREQKYILQRQIKQQRELNNRSESEKDRELQVKSDELEQTQHLLDEAERATSEAQAQLRQVLADMDTLQKTTAANEAASASSSRAVQDQLKDRTARIAALEADLDEAQSRLETAEASIAATQSELEASNAARKQAEAELASLQSQLASAIQAAESASAEVAKLQGDLRAKDDELDRMNMMVVELKTEVAVTKAELDGAYGSRKQRAAEAAALSSSAQSEELNQTIVRLRAELENALRDLEEITRESIAAERERVEIEGRLDQVVAAKAELEAEVSGLRERLEKVQEELDTERLKPPTVGAGGAGAGAGRAGANVMAEQFRGVMKEERKKFQEEMREEQMKRRRVEEELRTLKKAQGNMASTATTRAALNPG
ncbi:hypothetical protein N657DRAFT_656902 [Parathielavia appendiculata]|uniref:Up-regulated during septation protein 1 domain-containing protein n=1 Tax=Parathielavia appendiculata TaxID=2587402 RepID=A0AAN6TXZ1_9PEZI|nr:hypothetical protein N657DRAFT_656902 [Parathielavia appendiculata]